MSAPARKPSRLPRIIKDGGQGTEDELATQPRVTSRSPTDGTVTAPAALGSTETPNANLRQLAGIIQKPSTPLRRVSSTGPTSARRIISRTPATQSRASGPGKVWRPASFKKGAPTTPHAIRALQQRRAAALTPGRDRRRSGRVQRETPRDALRTLSRILANTTRPIDPSPHTPQIDSEGGLPDQVSDGEHPLSPDLPKPRLSEQIDGVSDDDDSFHLPAPRFSVSFHEDTHTHTHTQRSPEVPRRAVSEEPIKRLSRGSFGTVRLSDRFVDIAGLDLDDGLDGAAEAEEARVALMNGFDDEDHLAVEIEQGGDTQDLRSLIRERSDRSRTHVNGGPHHSLRGDEDATFAFDIPHVPEGDTMSPETDRNSEFGASHHRPGISSLSARIDPPGRGHKARKRQPKVQKLTRDGVPYPSLPALVVKKLAASLARSCGSSKAKINKASLGAIMQASDWFFEQIGVDLKAYADHANKKTIDETDVITLMKRQRQLAPTTTPFSLAQKYLSRELLQEVRMASPANYEHRTSRKLHRSKMVHEGLAEDIFI